jgi:5-methylcytosine-specific restriction endonuclease McrA
MSRSTDPADRERQRAYRRKRWRDLRAKFLRSHPTCVACGKPATHVDHVYGHGPDKSHSFHDTRGLQALCASCHSRKGHRAGELKANLQAAQPAPVPVYEFGRRPIAPRRTL